MRSGLLVAFLALLLAGCAHRKHTRRIPVPPPPGGAPASGVPPASEVGIASWYGHPYHGRVAASGEVYDMETFTAAHRTLPFQTWVRVVNLENDRTVEVRINDRGPFIDGRIIDLSHAAANAIGLIGPGTARVRVDVISSPTTAARTGGFAVQVGAFRSRENAERLRAQMAARYGPARVIQREGNPIVWRVVVGTEASEGGAQALSDQIRRDSGEKNTFVVRLDS